MNNVGNVWRANHFKVEEEVVLSGGAVSKSREVGPESRIEDFLSENLGRVLIAKGLLTYLRHHTQDACTLVVREVAKLALNIFPLHYVLRSTINFLFKSYRSHETHLVVIGSVRAQWCFESWSKYITHWVSST